MTRTIDTVGAPEGLDAPAEPVEPDTAPRRARRADRLRRRPVTRTVRGRRKVVVPAERLSAAELAQRVPFVVVMLLLIGTGVGGTLLLSAQTTQDTYDLQSARAANVELVERAESLRASNERARSAEILATRAERLGMVGVASAPILTRGSDGVVEIVGEPTAELGAPIKPLQPPPVSSDSSRPPVRDGFDPPPAQTPQDRAPRGVAPVPYPPTAGPPGPVAPPASPEEAEAPAPEPDAPAPAPPAPAGPAGDPALLAPVPGQNH